MQRDNGIFHEDIIEEQVLSEIIKSYPIDIGQKNIHVTKTEPNDGLFLCVPPPDDDEECGVCSVKVKIEEIKAEFKIVKLVNSIRRDLKVRVKAQLTPQCNSDHTLIIVIVSTMKRGNKQEPRRCTGANSQSKSGTIIKEYETLQEGAAINLSGGIIVSARGLCSANNECCKKNKWICNQAFDSKKVELELVDEFSF